MGDEEGERTEKRLAYLGDLLEGVCDRLDGIIGRLDKIIERLPSASPAPPLAAPQPAPPSRKGTRLSEVAARLKNEQSKAGKAGKG